MTDEYDEPTEQRRRLAALLRDLRQASGLDQTALGERAGMSQSKASRLEKARQVPTVADAESWGRAVGATSEQQAALVRLTEAALTEAVSWQEELRKGLAAKQQRIHRAERAASTVRVYSVVVPGLMQTAEYARRLVALGEGLTPGVVRDMPAAVTARLERQQVLYEPGRHFEFVVPEAALRWRPGPVDVQLAQLDRVAALSTLETVTFGVLPWDAQAAAVVPHEFVMFGDPEKGDDAVVVIETITRELHIRDDVQVATYVDLWGRLVSAAVYGEDARATLRQVADDLRGP